jgi:hypothetical protein
MLAPGSIQALPVASATMWGLRTEGVAEKS